MSCSGLSQVMIQACDKVEFKSDGLLADVHVISEPSIMKLRIACLHSVSFAATHSSDTLRLH